MKNWLIVANSSKARFLEEPDTPGAYVHVADLVHTQSRQKGSDLETAAPGHVQGGAHGSGSSSYDHRTDVRERERDRFAQQVAVALNAAIAAGHCAGVVLVASNPFLGHVKSHLSEQARKALLRCVASDYTALHDAELAQRLGPVNAMGGHAPPPGRPQG
jgi:protein required for attachment to host cells